MNSSVTIKEIEFIILKFSKIKSSSTDDVTGEFYQIIKEELTSALHNFLQKTEEETLPISSYETTLILTRKPNINSRYKKKTIDQSTSEV